MRKGSGGERVAQPGVKGFRSIQDNLLRMVDVLRCCERREVVDRTLDAKLLGAREAVGDSSCLKEARK